MTELQDPLALQAATRPRAIALLDKAGGLTYQAYFEAVEATVTRLQQSGLTHGARVALLGVNSRAMVVTCMALMRSGMIACPLSTRLPDSSIQSAMQKLQTEVLLSDRSDLPVPARSLSESAAGAVPGNSVQVVSPSAINPDQPVVMLSTSGSTAEPKIAALTYGNLYFNALGSNENIPITEVDRWLLSLPLYHVGGIGIVFRTLLGGGTVVLPDPAQDTLPQARQFGVTLLSLVTTQLRQLLDQPRLCSELATLLKTILLGGSPFPASLIERALAAGLPLTRSYGLTEAASQVTATAPEDTPDRLLGSGRVLPYREIRIDEESEIHIRGNTVFAGYWQDGQIENRCDADGWYATGDRGLIDADGYLVVLGRRDNMFISGGENIQPEEIEQALMQLDNVLEALVVAVDDDQYGQRPVAFVRMVDGQLPSFDSISKGLRLTLPGHKIPDRIYPWPREATEGVAKPSRAFFRLLAANQI